MAMKVTTNQSMHSRISRGVHAYEVDWTATSPFLAAQFCHTTTANPMAHVIMPALSPQTN